MATWGQLINNQIKKGDKPIIACTLTEEELEEEFDSGYGSVNGKPFTAWSDDYVYFPVEYDGEEYVGRAPRNPCSIETKHI